MRLQRITFPDRPDLTRYAGSAADAREARNMVAEAEGLKQRSAAIEQVEVDTKKDGLIAFINRTIVESAKGARTPIN